MITVWNIDQIFEEISDYWFPKVIGETNGQLIKAAKLKGELAWHAHDEEDELFIVVKGALRIEFEDDVAELKQGDLLNVPRGVRHNPVAREECWVLLIEPRSTLHTGSVTTQFTRSLEDQLR